MFATVAEVLSDAQQVGSDVVITHDPQNVVTLHNMQLSSLHASDVHTFYLCCQLSHTRQGLDRDELTSCLGLYEFYWSGAGTYPAC